MREQTRWSCALCAAAISASGAGCGGSAPGGEDLGSSEEAVAGDALPGLTTAQNQAFANGKATFNEVETPADGLGPAFNEKSCGTCHNIGGTGGTGAQFEVRAGRLVNGTFNDLANEGGQLFQLHGIGGSVVGCNFNGEVVPADANVQAKRRTTALFGLGFVDATPDATFTALAASQPSAIRGQVNMVFNISAGRNTAGKFSWKSQVPTLFQFSGDAYLNEMGITNPQFPVENLPQGSAATLAACDKVPELKDDGDDVQAFTDFMQVLAPAPRPSESPQALAGDAVFTRLGCDGCHVRNLTSGSSPIAALSRKTYHPFSDFLLHDMGSLGDNIGNQGQAGLRQMRTAPLWGIRFANPNDLLHDGRAHSFEAAIRSARGAGCGGCRGVQPRVDHRSAERRRIHQDALGAVFVFAPSPGRVVAREQRSFDLRASCVDLRKLCTTGRRSTIRLRTNGRDRRRANVMHLDQHRPERAAKTLGLARGDRHPRGIVLHELHHVGPRLRHPDRVLTPLAAPSGAARGATASMSDEVGGARASTQVARGDREEMKTSDCPMLCLGC